MNKTSNSSDLSVSYFSASDPLDEQILALKNDGAIVVRDLASTTLVDQVASELQPFFDATGQNFEDGL